MIVLFPTEESWLKSIATECSVLFNIIHDGIIPVSLSMTLIINTLFIHQSNGTIEKLFWFIFVPILILNLFSITYSGKANEQLADSV